MSIESDMWSRLLAGALLVSILFGVICISSVQGQGPSITFAAKWEKDNLIIDARIADAEELTSATLYVIDAKSRDVVWTEHRILRAREANLSFLWPRQSWRISNGTNFIEPAVVVNTIDLPPEEAPYMVYSAPCQMALNQGEDETTALAYFDEMGRFHSLRDLSGKEYYRSMEFLRSASPTTPYGRYVKNNITLVVGQTALRFFWLNLDHGLNTFPAMVLDRSPIQHYTLIIERRASGEGPFVVEIEAEDLAGVKAKEFSEPISPIRKTDVKAS